MLNLALVLTAVPGTAALSRAHTDAIWSGLTARRGAGEWLAEGEAWQARFSADVQEADSARNLAERILRGLAVDINVIADARVDRRKRLLVADMESTIIEQECLDEIAKLAGLDDRIADITRRAMRGEIEFEGALRERVALLAGLDADILDRVYDGVSETPGARTLVATMKKHGAHCALVSGGFSFFTKRVAMRLGFDTEQANELEIAGGKLTGRVCEPILGREAKLSALEKLVAVRSLDIADALAAGDGANDLAMIQKAGLGVAFRAKPVVASQAEARIFHGDLTALLYLQGFRRAEFVE